MAAASFSEWRDKARLVFNTDPGDDVSEQQPDRLDEIAQYCPQLTFQQVQKRESDKRQTINRTLYLIKAFSSIHRLTALQRLMGFAISFSLGCEFMI
jgi:hypothetical protein